MLLWTNWPVIKEAKAQLVLITKRKQNLEVNFYFIRVHVEKLRNVNMKLRAKLKELNNLLQKQIERKSLSPSKVGGDGRGSPSPNKNHGATSEAY